VPVTFEQVSVDVLGDRDTGVAEAGLLASRENRCEKVSGSDGLPKTVGNIRPCSAGPGSPRISVLSAVDTEELGPSNER
jgi:hypothetical protein